MSLNLFCCEESLLLETFIDVIYLDDQCEAKPECLITFLSGSKICNGQYKKSKKNSTITGNDFRTSVMVK